MIKTLVGCTLITAGLFLFSSISYSQKQLKETFYYNPKGLSYIPPLSKPSIIYQGRLFAGRRQLKGLFSHLDNPIVDESFRRYKANKTASTIVSFAGLGLSGYSLYRWRSGDDRFNWYTFGGGLVLSGLSGYLNLKANEHLLNAVIVFDNINKSTTFAPPQQGLTVHIPLSN